MSYNKKLVLLDFLVIVAIVATFFVPSIAQDPQYHNFVDSRHELGIDNFWNVITNIPFAVVGLMGLHLLWADRKNSDSGISSQTRPMLISFFLGVLFTAFGSAYYHFNPGNQSLIWDRLPMTISFMAFFCLIMAHHLEVFTARKLLWPSMIVGIGSVLYWVLTERVGHGDLRPYALVQFLPIVLIPVIMIGSKPYAFHAKTVWTVIGFYALAKLLEHYDGVVYEWAGMSGHALKHLVASAGTYVVYLEAKKTMSRVNLGNMATF